MSAGRKHAMENLDLTNEQLSLARALEKCLQHFQFVLLIKIWYKTLTAVNVSRLLQSEAITINDELFLIGQLLEDLKRIRSTWSQIFSKSPRRNLNAFFRTLASCSGFSTLFLCQLLSVNYRSVS